MLKFPKILSKLLVIIGTLTFFAEIADARSLGGGKSFGRQSNNFSQRQTTPPQSAPAPQRTAPATAPAQQPAAAPQRNRWLGPLAGIATGLGLAALFSHLGMGGALAESMGSMLLIAIVVMMGLFLWRRMRGGLQPSLANGPAQPRTVFETQHRQSTATSSMSDATFANANDTNTELKPNWSIPADLDVDKFLRSAKVFFVRLQAGWDTADLEDIREFTTPEMFAEIKLQLNERGAGSNITDVLTIEAELLGVEHIPRDQLASVRFTGTLRPAPAAPIESFDEVWNLTKSPTNPAGWILAGIQQANS
jgi:predicted lipid-binding transport protein (Tim44 family)